MGYTTGAILETSATAVTLAEAKAWMRVTHEFEDAVVDQVIGSAIDFVGKQTGLRLQVESGMYVADCLPVLLSELPGPHHAITKVEVVHTGGPTVFNATHFSVDLSRPAPRLALLPEVTTPVITEPGAVIVHTVVGYGAWHIPAQGFPYIFPLTFGEAAKGSGRRHAVRGHADIVENQSQVHPLPSTLKQAVLLLAAHWFEHREAGVVGTMSSEVALACQRLIDSERQVLYG